MDDIAAEYDVVVLGTGMYRPLLLQATPPLDHILTPLSLQV